MARRARRSVARKPEASPACASTSDGPLTRAEALRREGERSEEYRAQFFTEAAKCFAVAGRHEAAEELFRAALADEGPVAGGVHGYFAGFLFAQGRSDEALDVIDAARKQRSVDLDAFVVIGETLTAHGHHRLAARWLTNGLIRYYGNLADISNELFVSRPDGRILAADRMRARRNAELEPDHIDKLIASMAEGTGLTRIDKI